MTDEEARRYKARFDAEVQRLLSLPRTHRDWQPVKGGRKASQEDLEYLEWLEAKKKAGQSDDDVPDFGANVRRTR